MSLDVKKAVVWLLAVSMLAAACSGGEEPAATATPTNIEAGARPTTEPPPTPEANPTSVLMGGGPVLTEIEDAYESEHFPADATVPVEAGAYFMDPATGEVERVATGGDGWVSAINPDNSLILRGTAGGRQWLIDRTAEAVFELAEGWQIAALGERHLVAQSTVQPETTAVMGRDGSWGGVSELPDRGMTSSTVVLSGDESAVALLGAAPAVPSGWMMYVMGTEGGGISIISDDWLPPEGYETVHVSLNRTALPDAFVVTAQYSAGDGTADRYETMIYNADGSLRATIAGGGPEVHISPDSTLLAWTETVAMLPSVLKFQAGIWPAVTVADAATGEIRFRVNGATLSYGPFLPGNRWLADSSGLVAAGLELGDLMSEYVLITWDGTVQPLFGSFDDRTPPLPSPHDPEIFAAGHTSAFDIDDGGAFDAGWPLGHATLHITPWGAAGSELRWAGSGGGGVDAARPHVRIVTPRVEQPPFDNTIRLRVATGDPCLETRTAPDAEGLDAGEVAGCLPDGTALTIAPRPVTNDIPIPLDETVYFPDYTSGITWLHVRTADGDEAWVDAAFLEWAE